MYISSYPALANVLKRAAPQASRVTTKMDPPGRGRGVFFRYYFYGKGTRSPSAPSRISPPNPDRH